VIQTVVEAALDAVLVGMMSSAPPVNACRKQQAAGSAIHAIQATNRLALRGSFASDTRKAPNGFAYRPVLTMGRAHKTPLVKILNITETFVFPKLATMNAGTTMCTPSTSAVKIIWLSSAILTKNVMRSTGNASPWKTAMPIRMRIQWSKMLSKQSIGRPTKMTLRMLTGNFSIPILLNHVQMVLQAAPATET